MEELCNWSEDEVKFFSHRCAFIVVDAYYLLAALERYVMSLPPCVMLTLFIHTLINTIGTVITLLLLLYTLASYAAMIYDFISFLCLIF